MTTRPFSLTRAKVSASMCHTPIYMTHCTNMSSDIQEDTWSYKGCLWGRLGTPHPLLLNQLHLLGLGGRDAHALYPTVGGVEDFELQPLVFDDFAFLGNASGKLTDQTGDGGGFVAFRPHAEEFIEAVDIQDRKS